MSVLVVDDGSTDRTAEVSREHGAEVLSLGANRGLPIGIASGYRWALEHDYEYCGRVDADGQHSAGELARLCSSSFAPTPATSPSGHASSPARATRRTATGLTVPGARNSRPPPRDGARPASAVRRRHQRPLRRQPEGAAAPRRAVHDRGTRSRGADPDRRRRPPAGGGSGEHGRARGGESKLRGSKAVKVVLTVAGTLVAAKLISARRSR